MFYVYYFDEVKTLEFFWGLDRINFALTDSDDESDESWIDADDATIWERGESTRRCANSFSYIGIRADGSDEASIDGVDAPDETSALAGSIGTSASEVDTTGEVFGPMGTTGAIAGGVGTTDEVFEPTDPVEAAAGGVDAITEVPADLIGAAIGDFDATNSVTDGVRGTDGGFELVCALTGNVGTIDGDFELAYVLTVGAGAYDGFLYAINSEIGREGGGIDAFDGYRKKSNQVLLIHRKKKFGWKKIIELNIWQLLKFWIITKILYTAIDIIKLKKYLTVVIGLTAGTRIGVLFLLDVAEDDDIDSVEVERDSWVVVKGTGSVPDVPFLSVDDRIGEIVDGAT